MTNPIIKIVNAETGKEIEREMNAQELAQYKLDVANYQAKVDAIAANEKAKQNVLNKLGLTADEVAALLS
jgi:hypothetical protein